MAEFSELLIKRRSIRSFKDKDVSLELIHEIIKESTYAPSSGNGQPWRFIVVNNRETIKRLSDESKKNLLASIEKSPDSPAKKYEGILRNKDFNVFYNAPCLVIIGGAKGLMSLEVDCALFACYFMFSAAARGLGTCWVNLGSDLQDPEILEEIGMPEDFRIVAPIIMGYPTGIPGPPQRAEPRILKVIS